MHDVVCVDVVGVVCSCSVCVGVVGVVTVGVVAADGVAVVHVDGIAGMHGGDVDGGVCIAVVFDAWGVVGVVDVGVGVDVVMGCSC